MNKNILLSFAFVLASQTAPVIAEELRVQPVAVAELFTSQGCSSCPPADALLTELDQRSDIIALAYHVDYWDYIGWNDTFGDPAYSKYQRAYAEAQGKSRIYTPQLMVNGKVDVVGSRESDITAAISEARLPIEVSLNADRDMLEVHVSAAPAFAESAVWLVTYRDSAEVKIERGENRGRILEYSQIVTGRQVLGMWEPDIGVHIKLPLLEILENVGDGAAIIVQEEKNGLPGHILGAASFEL